MKTSPRSMFVGVAICGLWACRSQVGSVGTSAGTQLASTSVGGTPVVAPTGPGPYGYAELDAAAVSPVDQSSLSVHVAYPTSGPVAGPYPVLIFAHGFLIEQSEYYSYLEQAASFGYVAMTVNYKMSAFTPNYANNTADFLSGLDWLATESKNDSSSPLYGLADTTVVGASGHSAGGLIAILAAASDARIRAVVTFDPVDASCSGEGCDSAASVLPLPIPTGFLGETLDETASSILAPACAPAARNYSALYALAQSPSLEVTVLGAGHISFLDSVSSCGVFCDACATPSAPQAQVLAIAHAYLVAFYERYLRGNIGYDAYLTGAAAQSLFVETDEATIVFK